MTLYHRQGTSFYPSAESALDIRKELPVGNYVVAKNPNTGQLYFDSIDGFKISGKVYGDTEQHATRILSTFNHRAVSTGVLLCGEKGSGKTLLAKMLSVMGLNLGYPTVTINQPWHGEAFNQLIQGIQQPAIILFDEFEKVYDRDEQASMLTLLDGVFPTKKLFILTCNDKWRIDAHMRNRPGRIFYMLEYSGLEQTFIQEYCEENLNNKGYIETICRLALMFDKFNFDILKAVCEECNRYNESPQQALKLLNAKPQDEGESVYDIVVFKNLKEIPRDDINDTWSANPLTSDNFTLWHDISEDDQVGYDFTPHDLKHVDPVAAQYTFINREGIKAVFTRRKENRYNYLDYVN